MLEAVPGLETLVVPIGGGGLISGIAIAAKSLKPDLRIIGVQARLYPSMYNVIKGEQLPMRGDTLAEGIAVKAPGRITTDIIRDLVDDIVLVTEDQIERAVAALISIEKTVVEGAGAAGLAAVLAARASWQRYRTCWRKPVPTSSKSRISGRFPTCRRGQRCSNS
jgi:threonine dehydratase